MTKPRMLVGLLGANIQGSMSPSLFADAFAAAGIDGYYHLMDADRLPGRLPQPRFDASQDQRALPAPTSLFRSSGRSFRCLMPWTQAPPRSAR